MNPKTSKEIPSLSKHTYQGSLCPCHLFVVTKHLSQTSCAARSGLYRFSPSGLRLCFGWKNVQEMGRVYLSATEGASLWFPSLPWFFLKNIWEKRACKGMQTSLVSRASNGPASPHSVLGIHSFLKMFSLAAFTAATLPSVIFQSWNSLSHCS